MQIAIDSYCYHRYFGEWYDGLQTDPGRRITVWDFLDKAQGFKVQGVSLESCFVPFDEPGVVARLCRELDQRGLSRVWTWGHPNGLRSGTDAGAAQDLRAHIVMAEQLGASVMRICAGGRRTRVAHWPDHKAAPAGSRQETRALDARHPYQRHHRPARRPAHLRFLAQRALG